MGLRYSARHSGGSLECIPREALIHHRAKVKKRWPIRCRTCRHKAAVWMTENQLLAARFRCSKCGGADVAKRI